MICTSKWSIRTERFQGHGVVIRFTGIVGYRKNYGFVFIERLILGNIWTRNNQMTLTLGMCTRRREGGHEVCEREPRRSRAGCTF